MSWKWGRSVRSLQFRKMGLNFWFYFPIPEKLKMDSPNLSTLVAKCQIRLIYRSVWYRKVIFFMINNIIPASIASFLVIWNINLLIQLHTYMYNKVITMYTSRAFWTNAHIRPVSRFDVCWFKLWPHISFYMFWGWLSWNVNY